MQQGRRWAMVTGSSSGIGKATALVLAKQGWNVAVHYARSEQKAKETADRIRDLGGEAEIFQADLSKPGAGPALVEDVWKKIGGVEAWVHAAGADVLTGSNKHLCFSEKMELVTLVDLWGTLLTCREAGQRMFSHGRGVIVTIGWDQSATGMDGDSGELFAAIKGAIAAFSRSLAKSLAPAVRVHCVAPGWIRTAWGETAPANWQQRVLDETPLKRWGTPEDVAEVIGFLVSSRAEFLTGQTINVNGGVVTS